MYPLQGSWTVENYLGLSGGLLVEYTDGFIQVLPMPDLLHQWIVRWLFRQLDSLVSKGGLGEVLLAPLPVELSATRYREPDVVFLKPQRIENWRGHPRGVDLVIEVVSEGPDSWQRDHVEKRVEYALAAIDEYWIVDPQQRTITVLTLEGFEYREHGTYRPGDTAQSVLLSDFRCEVAEVFAKCDQDERSRPMP